MLHKTSPRRIGGICEFWFALGSNIKVNGQSDAKDACDGSKQPNHRICEEIPFPFPFSSSRLLRVHHDGPSETLVSQHHTNRKATHGAA